MYLDNLLPVIPETYKWINDFINWKSFQRNLRYVWNSLQRNFKYGYVQVKLSIWEPRGEHTCGYESVQSIFRWLWFRCIMYSHVFQEVLCIAWSQIYQENTLGITPKKKSFMYLVRITFRNIIVHYKISANKANFEKEPDKYVFRSIP